MHLAKRRHFVLFYRPGARVRRYNGEKYTALMAGVQFIISPNVLQEIGNAERSIGRGPIFAEGVSKQ